MGIKEQRLKKQFSLFAWWMVKASVRAWNKTHTYSLHFRRRTYCHVHNFLNSTMLQAICFVYFCSSHSYFHFSLYFFFRIATLFFPYYIFNIVKHATVCKQYENRHHITRFHIHIFHKMNENILMSSLNIT